MDLTKLNIWYVKAVYVAIAALLMIGAIISALNDQQYLVLVFIVAASLVIVTGSLFFAYLFKQQKIREVKKL
ncbi:hypothetical protein [Methanocella arvoryzae]|uniref:Uncharacterized protein n=1 Tax=Methanocella arvoryzae (strain DSM 22066 / NBRC 105507 / MRE50) TaxID=351160 RepID=Q0W7D5_METAR|nr:hypothetical protein [Methanocella arvoryzae]CAJ35708.1 hypothetical protein RCIX235 [Methanocella arvoryzae MRE50]